MLLLLIMTSSLSQFIWGVILFVATVVCRSSIDCLWMPQAIHLELLLPQFIEDHLVWLGILHFIHFEGEFSSEFLKDLIT